MKLKKICVIGLTLTLAFSVMTGCSSSAKEKQVVIYSNADEEAVKALENALDQNGYKGKYIIQTYGTSELGGKLLAEGTNLEADLVTMSTFYLQSAQDQNNMFLPLEFEVNTLEEVPDYTAPITSQEGAIILNTELIHAEGLTVPASLKDLTKEEYQGEVLMSNPAISGTNYAVVNALLQTKGEEEGWKYFR